MSEPLRRRLKPEEWEAVKRMRATGAVEVPSSNDSPAPTSSFDYLQDKDAEMNSVFGIEPEPVPPPDEFPAGIDESEPHYFLDGKRVLVIGDLHVPFHDAPALKAAIDFGVDRSIDTLLINGDFGDFYSISRWQKNPDLRNLHGEVMMMRRVLEILRRKLPNTDIKLKLGNHDERLAMYIDNLEDLRKFEEVGYEKLLHLKQFDIECIKDKRLVRAGKLNILHGHEFYGGGVNVARGVRMKANANILVNHFHTTQEEVVPTVTGELMGGWAIGCLCCLRFKYSPFGRSNHGAAFVEVESSGNFHVENKKIYNGQVL